MSSCPPSKRVAPGTTAEREALDRAGTALRSIGLRWAATAITTSRKRETLKRITVATVYRIALGDMDAVDVLDAVLALADVQGATDYVRACAEREADRMEAKIAARDALTDPSAPTLCQKIKYPTVGHAVRAKQHIRSHRAHRGLSHYHCTHCGAWHLGRNGKANGKRRE